MIATSATSWNKDDYNYRYNWNRQIKDYKPEDIARIIKTGSEIER